MGNPLDDALGDLDHDKESSKHWQRHGAWQRLLARKKIVDTIEAFLRRMNAAGNPGTYRLKQGFLRKETVWHVGWIDSEARGGFLLTPDGRLSSAGYGRENEWTPYSEARFFSLDGAEAQAIEREGTPEQSMFQGRDLVYMPEADAVAGIMASLIREHVG